MKNGRGRRLTESVLYSHRYRSDWLRDLLVRVEMQVLREAIFDCSGNLSEAARVLGISRSTMHRRVNEDNDALSERANAQGIE